MGNETKTVISVECIDQTLRMTQAPTIASGGVKENAVEFTFGALWDDLILFAVFYRKPSEVYHVRIEDGRCIVPREVTRNPGCFFLGVMGAKDGVTRTSTVLSYRVEAGAITDGIEPPEPTPSIYAQILASVQSAEQIAQSVRNDADAGKFNGAKGEKGDTGAQGVQGVQGIQGVKGEDGKDGVSPSVEISRSGDTTTIAITDASGVHTAGIKDGSKGDKGEKGDPGKDGSDAEVTAENIEAALGYAPVTPSDLAAKQNVLKDADKQSIVKTGMTSGAAWTAAEQKAARERMGVDKAYELIEEISLTEETSYLVRNVSLRTMYLEMETPDTATANGADEYVVLNIGSSQLSIYCGKIVVTGNKQYAKLLVEQKGGKYMVTSYGAGNPTNALSPYFQHNAIGVDGDKISKIHLTNTQLPVGTIIKIYGVSA